MNPTCTCDDDNALCPSCNNPNARTTAEVVALLRSPGVADAKVWFGFAPGVGGYIHRTPDDAIQLVRSVTSDWRFNAWRKGDAVWIEYVGNWN